MMLHEEGKVGWTIRKRRSAGVVLTQVLPGAFGETCHG